MKNKTIIISIIVCVIVVAFVVLNNAVLSWN